MYGNWQIWLIAINDAVYLTDATQNTNDIFVRLVNIVFLMRISYLSFQPARQGIAPHTSTLKADTKNVSSLTFMSFWSETGEKESMLTALLFSSISLSLHICHSQKKKTIFKRVSYKLVPNITKPFLSSFYHSCDATFFLWHLSAILRLTRLHTSVCCYDDDDDYQKHEQLKWASRKIINKIELNIWENEK